MEIAALTRKAIAYDHGDPRRVHHLLKVHAFARLLGQEAGLTGPELGLLEAAALLHDIGIHAAEEKYGSADGKLQEQEGPPVARTLLAPLGCPREDMDRICALIARHHTYTAVVDPLLQLLIEADFLVNAYEDSLSPDAIRAFRDKVFRTPGGTALLNTLYDL